MRIERQENRHSVHFRIMRILPIFANCGDPGKGAVTDCGNWHLTSMKLPKRMIARE
jgi:hypothetical protein